MLVAGHSADDAARNQGSTTFRNLESRPFRGFVSSFLVGGIFPSSRGVVSDASSIGSGISANRLPREIGSRDTFGLSASSSLTLRAALRHHNINRLPPSVDISQDNAGPRP